MSCIVSEQIVRVDDGQADSILPVSRLYLSSRSRTFRGAVEAAKEDSKFMIVAPSGFFQMWVHFVRKPTEASLDSTSTADALQTFQVCDLMHHGEACHSAWHVQATQSSVCHYVKAAVPVPFKLG